MDDFLASPTVGVLKSFKKTELLEICRHLELTEVKPAMRKARLAREIVEYYIDENVFAPGDLEQFPAENPNIEMELKLKMLEIEREGKKRI